MNRCILSSYGARIARNSTRNSLLMEKVFLINAEFTYRDHEE